MRSQQLKTAARVLPSPDRRSPFSGAQRVRRAATSARPTFARPSPTLFRCATRSTGGDKRASYLRPTVAHPFPVRNAFDGRRQARVLPSPDRCSPFSGAQRVRRAATSARPTFARPSPTLFRCATRSTGGDKRASYLRPTAAHPFPVRNAFDGRRQARVLSSPDRRPPFSGAQRVRSLSAVTTSPPYRTECLRRSPVPAPAGAPRPAAAFHRPHCSKSRTPRARPAPRTRG